MGDIHGDIVKAAAALCAAGVLGEEDGLPIWTGGDTTVVQIGDVLDRGDSEIGERLQPPPPLLSAAQASLLHAIFCSVPGDRTVTECTQKSLPFRLIGQGA